MKDVIIKIKGTQFVSSADSPEGEVIELTTVGQMDDKNGKTVLTYSEDNKEDGAEVITTLKISGEHSVVMQRSGGNSSRLQIEKGQRHLSHYETGYGNLMIGVFGESIRNEIGQDGGRLFMSYTIDVNCNMISRNELEISVQEDIG